MYGSRYLSGVGEIAPPLRFSEMSLHFRETVTGATVFSGFGEVIPPPPAIRAVFLGLAAAFEPLDISPRASLEVYVREKCL